MKKYIIFAISFLVLFSLLQVLFGMLLTFIYTPNLEEAGNMSGGLPQSVVISSGSGSFLPPFIIAFLSASIAYFIPNKIIKK